MTGQRLQPFVAAERLKRAYHSYITTSFPLRRVELREQFDRLVSAERLLWQDAFVSLARTPKPGRTFAELAATGAVAPDLTRHAAFGFERLHDHQSRAVERLSSRLGPRSTVVATGTGSGKTESFLVPILDHCLREPGPGVKAIVLYPMNALANDQLKRLRRLLAGTDHVTFARFTGDTPYDADRALSDGQPARPDDSPPGERYYRKEILESPPNLLLTNYTMLELLLTRKEERTRLLRGAPLRYLVVDEVHTFQGLRGTEVACLLRRLKEHVGLERGRLTCVGTSATLQTGGDPTELVRFASKLFGEPFEPDAVVVEEPQPLPETGPAALPSAVAIPEELLTADVTEAANLRPLAEVLLGVDLAGVRDGELPGRLHDLTRTHPLFMELERFLSAPRPVSALAEHLRGLPGRAELDGETLHREATAAMLVGASALAARPEGEEAEPRFRPKVHLLMRSLSPLARCLDPGCGALLADGRLECRREPHADRLRLALPLGVCRTCGQDYWMAAAADALRGSERQSGLDRALRVIGTTLAPAAEQSRLTVYLMPGDDAPPSGGEGEDDEPAPDLDDEQAVAVAEEGRVARVDMVICSGCRTLRVDPAQRCLGPGCSGGTPALPVQVFVGGSRCPACLSTGKGRRPDIITPLRSGANSSVSVLTTELFDQLSDDERRTLIFADSRQDTAHQAGFLRERHQVFVRRQLIYQSLAQDDRRRVALPDLAAHAYHRAVERFGEAEALNLLIAPDQGDVVTRGFFSRGALPEHRDIERARRRLNWHCHLELTSLAQQRNAVEREGLIGVVYSRLDELAARVAPELAQFGVASATDAACLLRGLLDLVRGNKAVDYAPFREYLDERSPSVDSGEAVPSRYLRIPVVYGPRSLRHRYYQMMAWYNERGRRTGVDDLVARLRPSLDTTRRRELIDILVERLRAADFLVARQVGTVRRHGRQQIEGLQLAPGRIEVQATRRALRCPRCQRARAWSLMDERGREVCLTYECGGAPEPYVPDPDRSYYVELYERRTPKPMHAMEHSGQLPGELRQKIERQFNQQEINVLVCTPTLELGVDLPDLVALLMRNIPPTPANYAQRAGRAGRERRIALVVSHAGQGPHDSYFFLDPAQMITGEIRAPVLLLDNEEIVRRHVRSLVLERLETEVPSRWERIADVEQGEYRSDLADRFGAELVVANTRERIAGAVERAFADAALPWLDRAFVEATLDDFPGEVEGALRTWCEEYAELADEHWRIKSARRVNTADEKRQLTQLERRMETMREEREYNPLAFLARCGVLPRYGFPGHVVQVIDERQRSITQRGAFGITEYAPGNRVYVAGRRLTVGRVRFAGGAKEDPRDHTRTYRFCDRCTYATENAFATTCPLCGGDGGERPLRTAEYIDYAMGQGISPEFITDEDEYRSRSEYDTAVYLAPLGQGADAERHQERARTVGAWPIRFSRRREIQLFNRGLAEHARGPHEGFMVCLACGSYHSPAQQRRDERGDPLAAGSGHAAFCPVGGRGWPTSRLDAAQRREQFPEVESHLHLRVAMSGDVVELRLPDPVADRYAQGERAWVTTLGHAVKLGMQIEMHVDEREIEQFVVVSQPPTGPEVTLAYYDTLPGGTGYLARLFERLPDVAATAHRHLVDCPCERACYRCLMQFWNQRDHQILDKRLVLPALGMFADGAVTTPAPSLSQRELFDSVVESALFERLRTEGLPRPRTGRANVLRDASGMGILQMDLSWPGRRLLALLDGREYHTATAEQVLTDEDKRNRAIAAGWRVLEFTGWEVVHRLDEVAAEIREAIETRQTPVEFLVIPRVHAGLAVAAETGVRLLCSDALPPALASLEASGFAGAGRVQAAGLEMEALALRQDPPAAVLGVNSRAWMDDAGAWRRQLRLMRQLSRAGVQCFRLPLERLDDPGGLRHALELMGI